MTDNLPANLGERGVATAEPVSLPAVAPEISTPAPTVRLGPSPLTKPKKQKAAPPAVLAIGEGEIDRAVLYQALRFLVRVCGTRNTLPILGDVLFEENTILATDLDIGLRVTIPGIRKLPAAIPGKLLRNVVAAARGRGIRIVSAEHEKATFNVVVNDAVIIGHDAKEFPSVPGVKGGAGPAKVAELPSLEPVLPAVSVDETRINLTGVYLRFCKNVAVATDGHRLHRMKLLAPNFEGDYLVQRKAIELADDIAAATRSPIIAHFYKDVCVLKVANYEIAGRYIEGTFPDYDQVIPKKAKHHLTVDKGALMAALAEAVPFTSERAKGIGLEVTEDKPDQLQVATNDPDKGNFRKSVPCFGGGPVKFGLNGRYLLDALRFVDEERVVIQLTDEVSPMKIETSDGKRTFIVMPMRL